MPTDSRHLAQASTNAAVLAQMGQGSPRRPDWEITLAFYVAVHLVEAFLARANPPVHSASHAMRNAEVRRRLPTRESIAYLALHSASVRARYDCLLITPAFAAGILQAHYEPVRAHLCALLGITL